MSKVTYTITEQSLTVVIDGKMATVKRGAPNFLELRKALLDSRWDDAVQHLRPDTSLVRWAKGKFSIEEGKIVFEGKPVEASLANRISEMASAGEDPSPLLRFWERLKKNPSKRSVDQLWRFLENQGIPLTDDGHFLAYKAIRPDWKDVHSGTFDNRPGVTNSMPRNEISDDPAQACHEGLHVGALEYAQNFGGSDRRVVICRVDPEDVVCVPFDHSSRKMRVCRYTVVGVHGEAMPSTTIQDSDIPKAAPKGKRSKRFQELDAMGTAELMSVPMDELRAYAAKGLSIVGASRISGGKLALVDAIVNAR